MDIKVDSNTVIVFDLDDTLYNELDYLRSAYIEIAKDLSPDTWEELFLKMFSLYRSQKNVFQILAEEFSIPLEKLIATYRNHIPNIQPFNGVLELIESIKEKKGKIAIITDGRTATQNTKIKALGIKDKIDKIVISEEIGTEKPSEQNFLAIEKTFPKSSYTYIADNCKKDFISPNKLNWNSVCLIDNGKNIHKENHLFLTKEKSPKHYIFSILDLRVIGS